MSRIHSDPTANTAIANVMRSQREKMRLAAKRAAESAGETGPRGEGRFRRDAGARKSLPISRRSASDRR